MACSRLTSRLMVAGQRTVNSRVYVEPIICYIQTRNTYMMKRKYPPRLAKLGVEQFLRREQFVYDVTYKLQQKISDMTIILKEYVEGIGDVGDVVKVKAYIARHDLLLPGLAVYYTPENMEKNCNLELDRPRRTPFCMKTLKYLEDKMLFIPMNTKTDLVLESKHVRVAFRLTGVELTDSCIELPEKSLMPDQTEPFFIKVIVNQLFTANVRAQRYHYQLDQTGKPIPPDVTSH